MLKKNPLLKPPPPKKKKKNKNLHHTKSSRFCTIWHCSEGESLMGVKLICLSNQIARANRKDINLILMLD